jgi:hypothetical protein
MNDRRFTSSSALFLCLVIAACSDDKNASSSGGTSSSGGGTSSGGATPELPRGAAAVDAWLATGAYKAWNCEPTVHEARSPSPHGFNRICSNNAIATNASGTGVWPKGAAAVKELFDSANAATPVGYSYYLKTEADSAGGANWYWYERVPQNGEPSHGAQGVVADGLGNAGAAQTICVGCHGAAGADAPHTPSAGGRDQVYTPVK